MASIQHDFDETDAILFDFEARLRATKLHMEAKTFTLEYLVNFYFPPSYLEGIANTSREEYNKRLAQEKEVELLRGALREQKRMFEEFLLQMGFPLPSLWEKERTKYQGAVRTGNASQDGD